MVLIRHRPAQDFNLGKVGVRGMAVIFRINAAGAKPFKFEMIYKECQRDNEVLKCLREAVGPPVLLCIRPSSRY